MNRRFLFKALSTVALGLLASPILAAKTLPRRIHARAARWRHFPTAPWLDAYGGRRRG